MRKEFDIFAYLVSHTEFTFKYYFIIEFKEIPLFGNQLIIYLEAPDNTELIRSPGIPNFP